MPNNIGPLGRSRYITVWLVNQDRTPNGGLAELASRLIRMVLFLVMSALLLASAASTFAQTEDSNSDAEYEPDCDSRQDGFLNLHASKHGYAVQSLELCVAAERELDLRQKLPVALGCDPGQSGFSVYKNGDLTGLQIDCPIRMSRKALQYSAQIDLSSTQDLLRNAGLKTLTVNLSIPIYGTAVCDPPPSHDEAYPEARECTYFLQNASNDPRIIRLAMGYSSILLARIAAVLGLLLLIPIVLTVWFRRRARSVPEDSKPAVIFAYRRFITWTALGGILVWWTAIDSLHVDSLAEFVAATASSDDAGVMAFLPWLLLWLPPVIVYFLCLTLSSPIHSLRGVTRTQLQAIRQSFWTVARFALPIPLVVLGINELFSAPRVGVLLFGAAIFAGRLVQRKLADSMGTELHAVTTGELRDRAFAIAQKAKAKLNQLYVLPAERMRMANAFAHAASNIFLTDYLLKNLSRREVDAVIGHEVAHLQKKHLRTRLLVMFALFLAVTCAAIWSDKWIPSEFPTGPVVYGFILLLMFLISRRNEFAADAGAVKLTGDAEAMITALARITRLNTMPIQWGKLDEKLLTHPSTLRRIRHLARIGSIPETRIPELLNQSATPPADVYPIPATALPAGKVFSSRYKTRLSQSMAWIVMLSAAAFPALVALTIRWAHLSGTSLTIAYAAGIPFSIAMGAVLVNFLPMRGSIKLEAALRRKLEKASAPPEFLNGLFVSLAPDSRPLLYEANWSWDIGFLTISDIRLSYFGEEARFSLTREQITRVSLGPGPVSWFRAQAVYVAWQDESGNERIFNLRAIRCVSMLEMARKTRRLADELEKWHRGIALPSGSLLSRGMRDAGPAAALGVPGFGGVTSISPRFLVRGPFLARIFLFDTFVAAGVAILCGLRFPMLDSVDSSSNPTGLSLSGGAFLYVIATVWLWRVFTLWPFWRYREPVPTESSVTPQTLAASLSKTGDGT
jgi:Zn-dependent protease with chaperone function